MYPYEFINSATNQKHYLRYFLQSRIAETYTIHPGYNQTHEDYHDLALVFANPPFDINISNKVKPISLPISKRINLPGDKATRNNSYQKYLNYC
jgi:hypothetical protein